MSTPIKTLWTFLVLCGTGCLHLPSSAETVETDICIYGGSASGVVAATQATRMGKTVALVEFGKHLGGLSAGGLGATDIGNKAAIGGLSRDFYRRLGVHYFQDEQWTFEPHVAEQTFQDIVKDAKLRVFFQQRLASVKKSQARILEIVMENGNVFRAKMFIDATYEGDLMAKAGVSYTVGREANSQYGETLNGIRGQTPKHQFTVAVDPYVKPGDPTSGLLPFIQSGDGGKAGEGDQRVQAYNFRLCMTTRKDNQVPFPKPLNYDANRYELLARYLAAKPGLKMGDLMNPVRLPQDKTDTNNNGPFSTDYIGGNYQYPDADYATRERIIAEHQQYIQGFLYFLAHDPRVAPVLQEEINRWGLAKDEFLDNDHWPHQLYIREARRMVSAYVMTENNCRYKLTAEDSVGLAAYNMDSHNYQRLVKNGRVENEGDVQVAPMKPYPLSYRALVPKQSECENLFVPICLSSSHIAYGSIRMEPVFMILGQSAATAACLAIDDQVAVQKLSYPKLRDRLLADHQILEWPHTPKEK